MNTKFGKLTDGKMVYASNSIETDAGIVVNPSEETYLANGWKKVVDEKPSVKPGFHLEISGWKETEDALVCVYKQIAGEAPVVGGRVFSKLKIVLALKKAGLWVLTKTWIEENGLYDLYLAAQDFSEDNEFFLKGKAELQQLARKTEAEIEAILSQCVAD